MNSNYDNEEDYIDLRAILGVLRRNIFVLILAFILGVGVAGGYTVLFINPVYESTSEIYILGTNNSITSIADLQIGNLLTSDYMELIKSRPVIEKVIDELKLDMDYGTFLKKISIKNSDQTRIIYITVKDNDAYMAKTMVDKLTDVSLKRIAEIMETEEPNIIDYGHIAEYKSSPNVKKNAAIGGLACMLAAAAFFVIGFILDDSIKNSDDVERYLGLNVIGQIPMDGKASKKKQKEESISAAKISKENK